MWRFPCEKVAEDERDKRRISLKDGRNIIPISNSNARCLIENWVEERAVQGIDPEVLVKGKITSRLQLLKDGHKALFSNEYQEKLSDRTTYRDKYTVPQPDTIRQIGSKKELMAEMYYNKISKQKSTSVDPEPPHCDFRSVKMVDYDHEFIPYRRAATRDHNYRYEQPATYWTDYADRIQRRTQVTTQGTVFRRNDAFSKPIGEYWGQKKPYETVLFPKK